MELADILSEDAVVICSDIKSKSELLKQLSDCAARVTGQDAATIFEAVNDREMLGSTGLGNGIAIPHGKYVGLPGVVAVFARVDPAIEFEAVDDQPVDIVVMLLAPLGAGADHLKALARVARMLRTDQVLARLRSSHDAREIYEVLTQPLPASQAA
jgi:PTS system nitrogen regulatory IIA component